MPILDNAVNTLGVFRRLAGLAGTIVTMYRHHFGLFWRIMMPVVFLVILFDIATFFRSVKIFEANDEVIKWVEAVKFGWNINTVTGISPTSGVSSRYEPGVTWELSFNPKLEIISDDAVIWIWHLNFRIFEYSLLLLVLCPLTFAVAQLYHHQKITARAVWRQTRRRTWAILGANLLLVLIVEAIPLLYNIALGLIPQHQPWYRISRFMLNPYLYMAIILLPCYFLVTFSLYNPCLILENKSALAVFRRSYEWVKGSWWRFFGIYFVTAWMASVITSVLFGFAFLALSAALPELARVRDALLPIRIFTLFLGGDVEIGLQRLPSVSTTVAIVVVRGLISAFLVPIWAILTTHLYLERVNRKKCKQ